MKNLLLILFLTISNLIYAQDFSSGALITDPETYDRIGTAPLPMGSNIPNIVDLSDNMPPVGNQYPQNSCVAWAVAYANYSYLNKSNSNCKYSQNGTLNNSCLFSPSFIYNQINDGQNKGTYFQDAFRIMSTQGVATLNDMPYIKTDWWTQPTKIAIQNASYHKIQSYWQLGKTGEDIFNETKANLAKGIPIIASVKVDNYLKRTTSFSIPYVWNSWNGIVENMGHAILIVGYDDEKSLFKFINSYGPNWGNNGYGYIAYGMFRKVVNQAFIITPQNQNNQNKAILAVEEKSLSTNDFNAGLYFEVKNVEHYQFPPGYIPSPVELFSKAMTFRGQVSLPKGIGNTAQILIYFYLNDRGQKGLQVASLNPITRTLNGQAVTGTPVASLDSNVDFVDTFYAVMRYSDLNIPKGYPYSTINTDLIAEPVLLIDGFPVRIGNTHLFFVRL